MPTERVPFPPADSAPAASPQAPDGAGIGTAMPVTLPEGPGGRLDRQLALALPDLSRSRLKALIEAGAVLREGAPTPLRQPATTVEGGARFIVWLPEAAPAIPQAQAIALDVLYEDGELIVIHKPAGMVVHPAPGNPDNTLVNALLAHCGDSLAGIGGVKRPGIVHRLDKDTSGVLVAAKTDRAHQSLSAQFADHSVERSYLAVVWGVPSPREGRIEAEIGRDPKDRKRMAVRGGGRSAVTHYTVLKPLGLAASLVECRLETGRTHQIRVHLTALGYPLIGDPVYGRASRARRALLAPAGAAAVSGFHRQALHAATLGFAHPATDRPMSFTAPPPEDFETLLSALAAPAE